MIKARAIESASARLDLTEEPRSRRRAASFGLLRRPRLRAQALARRAVRLASESGSVASSPAGCPSVRVTRRSRAHPPRPKIRRPARRSRRAVGDSIDGSAAVRGLRSPNRVAVALCRSPRYRRAPRKPAVLADHAVSCPWRPRRGSLGRRYALGPRAGQAISACAPAAGRPCPAAGADVGAKAGCGGDDRCVRLPRTP